MPNWTSNAPLGEENSSPTRHAVRTPAASVLVFLAVEVDVDGAALVLVQLDQIFHLLEARAGTYSGILAVYGISGLKKTWTS